MTNVTEHSETSFVYSLVRITKENGISLTSIVLVAICFVLMVILKLSKLVMKWKQHKLSPAQLLNQSNVFLRAILDLLVMSAHRPQTPHESSDREAVSTL